jgi:predicted Zn-dependent protease with MMP-like domain
MRSPEILPALTAGGLRARPRPTRRERFDALVLGIVAEIETRWQQHLGLVEYAVEDTPLVPDDWAPDSVPLSSLIRGTGGKPSRLVLFRRPIEHRCGSREELEAMVLMVIVEQVAELLGLDAEQVDPRYRNEE